MAKNKTAPSIYHYHPQSGELMRNSMARPDPMEKDKWLIPAHATAIAPPTAGEKEAAMFMGDKWVLVPDHRGDEYWLADKSHHTIIEIGEVKPDGALDAEPLPSVAELKKQRLDYLHAETASYITVTHGYSLEKQVNDAQRLAELAAGEVGATITTEEATELAEIRARIRWKNEQRAAHVVAKEKIIKAKSRTAVDAVTAAHTAPAIAIN